MFSAQTPECETYIRIWWRRYCCESHGGIVKILLHFFDYATQSWYHRLAKNTCWLLGKTLQYFWDHFWDPEFLFIILKGTFYSSHVRKPDKTHLERCAPAATIKQRKLHEEGGGGKKERKKKKAQEESSPQVHKGLVRIIRSPGGEGLSGVAWPARYTCLHD